jgi:hypothetical protein
MSPMVISSSATIPPENNQQKGKHVTEHEEQLERKIQNINILIKEKESLSKILEDTLEQTNGTQHLVEIIQVMEQFRTHLEIYHDEISNNTERGGGCESILPTFSY